MNQEVSAARFAVPPEVRAREVEGEIVLLSLQTNHYFGLDQTAARMWTLLAEFGEVERVVQTLLEEFDVDEAQVRDDLRGLIQQLVDRRLLRAVEG